MFAQVGEHIRGASGCVQIMGLRLRSTRVLIVPAEANPGLLSQKLGLVPSGL